VRNFLKWLNALISFGILKFRNQVPQSSAAELEELAQLIDIKR